MDAGSIWNNYNNLNNQANTLASGYQSGVSGARQSTLDRLGYNDQQNTLNNIRHSVADTENTISSLPQQVQQRTAGRLVTNGQLSRIQQAEQDPLVKQLGSLNNTMNVTQQGVNDINTQANAAGQDYTNGFNARLAALQDQAKGQLGIYNTMLQTNAANAAAKKQADLQQAMLDFSKQQYTDKQTADAKAAQDKINALRIQPTQPFDLGRTMQDIGRDNTGFFGLTNVHQPNNGMSGLEYLYNQIFNPEYVNPENSNSYYGQQYKK